MRFHDNGSFFSVSVSAREVEAFNRRWPCSTLTGRYWFQFDKRAGKARRARVQVGGFALTAADVNYEDDALTCDHCGERIESAYGDTADDEERAYGKAGAPESERENFGR